MSISSSVERLQLLSGATSMNIVLKLLHDELPRFQTKKSYWMCTTVCVFSEEGTSDFFFYCDQMLMTMCDVRSSTEPSEV